MQKGGEFLRGPCSTKEFPGQGMDGDEYTLHQRMRFREELCLVSG